MSRGAQTAGIAWLVTAIYYFYQYSLRSAPAVMMPQLSEAFGLSAMGVASMAGLFYYGYSPFSLVAGVAMDRLGPRKVVPIGAAAVGVGALLFSTGNSQLASIGRLVQGAGGVFALIGAVYIAIDEFSRVAGSHAHRRHADVRHGRRLRRPVRRRAADWRGRRVEHVLGGHGHRRARHQRAAVRAAAAVGAGREARRLAESGDRRARPRLSQSAIDPVRNHLGPAVHPDDDLRHDLGRQVPPGGARRGLRDGRAALLDGAGRMDHRLPAAGFLSRIASDAASR